MGAGIKWNSKHEKKHYILMAPGKGQNKRTKDSEIIFSLYDILRTHRLLHLNEARVLTLTDKGVFHNLFYAL